MARKGSASKSEEKAAASKKPELVPFDAWYQLLMSRDRSFKEWQREQLRAFMRAKGLSERENTESYDQAFKQF